MSPAEFFASIRERRRRSEQQSYEEGAQLRRRLQELLGVPTPTQKVETPSIYASSENEPACLLNAGFSEPGISETIADHKHVHH